MKRARLPAKPAARKACAGELLALRLGVDRGQHAVRAHAVQQMDAGDAGAGADLGHRLGVRGGGEQPQRGAGAGRHRAQPRLPGPVAGPAQGFVLGDKGVGERPARLPVAGNDPLLSP